MSDPQVLARILGTDVGENAILDLGLAESDAKTQAAVISEVGGAVLGRIMLETYKRLPVGIQDELDLCIEAGDSSAARTLLEQHIPNFGDFISEQSRLAYRRITEGGNTV
jgi:hypothetical protein